MRIFVVAACLMFAALAVPTSAAAQAAGAPQFVCNQVTGMTLTREWYQAGFEQAPGIADDRWQLIHMPCPARDRGCFLRTCSARSHPSGRLPSGTNILRIPTGSGATNNTFAGRNNKILFITGPVDKVTVKMNVKGAANW